MNFKFKKAFLLFILIASCCTGTSYSSIDLDDYRKRLNLFKRQLLKNSSSYRLQKSTINKSFSTIEIKDGKKLERVVKSDKNQAEFKNTLSEYRRRYLTKEAIDIGIEKKEKYRALLGKIEAKYKVPKTYLLAFWRAESSYGSFQGSEHMLTAVSTLMLEGRRETFFRKQLIAGLRIIQNHKLDPSKIKSSWAGGLGNFQFIPTTFEQYAVDENNDGRIDVFNDLEDAFGSAANYLSSMGWRYGERWGREVSIPRNFNKSLLGKKHDMKFWVSQGVRRANKTRLPYKNMSGKIIEVRDVKDGKRIYRYFLVYKNFDIIMRWNKSSLYAISVGSLSDKLK